MYIANLVSDYKGGECFCHMFHVICYGFFAVVTNSFLLEMDSGNRIDYMHQDMLFLQWKSQFNYV